MQKLENIAPEALWNYYQKGYHRMVCNGYFFRRLLRPALSHVFFQRAVPVFIEYARANHGLGDLPPGFVDQMESCSLTPRDLLHLDYAISLGLAEMQLNSSLEDTSILGWPGPALFSSFIPADMPYDAMERLLTEILSVDSSEEEDEELEDDFDDDDKDEENNPPRTRFDL